MGDADGEGDATTRGAGAVTGVASTVGAITGTTGAWGCATTGTAGVGTVGDTTVGDCGDGSATAVAVAETVTNEVTNKETEKSIERIDLGSSGNHLKSNCDLAICSRIYESCA
jgi:hypothetical protein